MASVLVIDDDEGHRTLLRHMLEGLGHEVVEALDGADGLRLFERHSPALVMTDINMPGLDGHEVIKAVRAHHGSVPIIALSGGSAIGKDDLLLQAASLGASEVITKPFEYGQIAGAVERALRS
jgi:CheY-like chemotaxis protein